jgi:hypothetical protein
MPMKSKFDHGVSDPVDQSPGKRVISGFWIRLQSLFFDVALLGLLGGVLESRALKMAIGGRHFAFGPYGVLAGGVAWSNSVYSSSTSAC